MRFLRLDRGVGEWWGVRFIRSLHGWVVEGEDVNLRIICSQQG